VTADLVIGLGCRPGTPAERVVAVLDELLAAHGLDRADVRAFATVSARAREPGLLAVAGGRLLAFAPEVLARVRVPGPSRAVAAAVGTPSVAEAAALHAAALLGPPGAAVGLVAGKLARGDVTAAAARPCAPDP
jgi:cobalamin biosynthesis protein CbiG